MDAGLNNAPGAPSVLGHGDDLERVLVEHILVAQSPALSPVVDPQAHLEGLLAEDADGAYRNTVVVDQPSYLFVRWKSAAMARADDYLDPVADKGLLVLGPRTPTSLRHALITLHGSHGILVPGRIGSIVVLIVLSGLLALLVAEQIRSRTASADPRLRFSRALFCF